MAIDHTNCTHPRTPAGRRACRDSRISPVEAGVREEVSGAKVRNRRLIALQNKLEGMAEGEHPRHDKIRTRRERIQPRRSGARVAIDASGCVQAALHTGRGKCACGWENWAVA